MDMDLHMEEWVQFSLFCYSPLFEGLLYIYFSLFLSLSLYPLYSLSKPFARLCFISVCLFQSTKKVEQQNPLALLSDGWCNGLYRCPNMGIHCDAYALFIWSFAIDMDW